MAFRITEYGGYANSRLPEVVPLPGMVQCQLSAVGSSVSTFYLSSATHLILIDTDGGAYITFGSSASTNVAGAGSSNTAQFSTQAGVQRIPASVAPIPFRVNPFMRVTMVST